MRLSKLILIFFIITCDVVSKAEDRLELHIFQYTDHNSKKGSFDEFQYMLGEKLLRFPDMLYKKEELKKLSILSQLKLNLVINDDGKLSLPSNFFGSLEEKHKYWEETGALAVLTGRVYEKENISYVNTTFFWGDLRGLYRGEMIKLKFPMIGSYYDSTKDSHLVAILYALSQEINKNCEEITSALYLLSEALGIYQN